MVSYFEFICTEKNYNIILIDIFRYLNPADVINLTYLNKTIRKKFKEDAEISFWIQSVWKFCSSFKHHSKVQRSWTKRNRQCTEIFEHDVFSCYHELTFFDSWMRSFVHCLEEGNFQGVKFFVEIFGVSVNRPLKQTFLKEEHFQWVANLDVHALKPIYFASTTSLVEYLVCKYLSNFTTRTSTRTCCENFGKLLAEMKEKYYFLLFFSRTSRSRK